MEPWEAFPKVWPTKAKFFSWLRENIHKEVYSGIEPRGVCLPPLDGWDLENALCTPRKENNDR